MARGCRSGLAQEEAASDADGRRAPARSGAGGARRSRRARHPARGTGAPRGAGRRAGKAAPEDARVLNNLAVAYETTGDFGKADELYRAALRLDPGNRDIRQNYDLFSGFHKELQSRSAPADSKPPDAPSEEHSEDA